jgi:hypothetical protein
MKEADHKAALRLSPMLRRACIYLGTTAKEAIVTALHINSAGVSFEQDEPAVIADWRQTPGLGVALRFALERFSLQERNLRNLKKTEWPSYRASSSRSVREFEATYMCISIQALNEAELSMTLGPIRLMKRTLRFMSRLIGMDQTKSLIENS